MQTLLLPIELVLLLLLLLSSIILIQLVFGGKSKTANILTGLCLDVCRFLSLAMYCRSIQVVALSLQIEENM